MLKWKTATGVPLEELFARLDEPLPPDAYKPIRGGKGERLGFTDIDPAYWLEQICELFGMPGEGWRFEVILHDRTPVETAKGQTWAVVYTCELRYRIVDENGQAQWSHPVLGFGSHEDAEACWALRGAYTSALCNAWRNLGSQRSVWQGRRGHDKLPPVKVETPVLATPETMARMVEVLQAKHPAAEPTVAAKSAAAQVRREAIKAIVKRDAKAADITEAEALAVIEALAKDMAKAVEKAA